MKKNRVFEIIFKVEDLYSEDEQCFGVKALRGALQDIDKDGLRIRSTKVREIKKETL